MAILYFLRHGETDWNVEGRLQGGRDIPLNDLGRVQAEEAGRRLKRLVAERERATGRPLDDLPWLVSPLSRARETAEIARTAAGLHAVGYRLEPRLTELTFGDWEGLTWPEVKRANPAGARARERDKWGFAPPQGESYAMLADRLRGFVDDLTQDTVAVAHGGVARALMVMIAGGDPRFAPTEDIRQGQVLVFEGGRAKWG